MAITLLVLLLAMTVLGEPNWDHLRVHPAQVTVREGEGFLVKPLIPPKYHMTRTCSLANYHIKRIYFISYGKMIPVPFSYGNSIVVTPYPVTEFCGFRVKNVTKEFEGVWEMQAKKYDWSDVSVSFNVTVVQERKLEQSPPILEGVTFVSNDSRTVIYSERGSVADLGSSLVLSCRAQSAVAGCTVTGPTTMGDHQLMEGAQGERYSALGTDFAEGICEFEIPTPIAQNESGIWRFAVKDFEFNYRQLCQFHLVFNDGKREGFNEVITVKTSAKMVALSCAIVPYQLRYCYLVKDSLLKTYKTASDDAELKMGSCHFSVEGAEGNYTCGYNAPSTGQPDYTKRIVVTRPQVSNELVTRHPNGSLTLECHTMDETPIESCLFAGPSGLVYNIPTDTVASDELRYTGRGFDKGDCGVTVLKESPDQNGFWNCYVNFL